MLSYKLCKLCGVKLENTYKSIDIFNKITIWNHLRIILYWYKWIINELNKIATL